MRERDMKQYLMILLTLTLTFSFSATHAEVYSWVDKDGKKHFGQEVPKEYAKKSKVIDVKSVNSMDETKVRPGTQPTRTPGYQQPQIPDAQDNNAENMSSCE